ncbi:IclR family transcriptional regulator [Natrinema sp. 1APR25-10V2]|uniref:IclR family transcriptional regulator n=1 Tax=Natrinema sp. 1APR25-10V2 TaxID=2951081 RepID=UPI002874A7AD|nr:IclR family transcriptional regulator [Natrinema sp. 1APR25-10V2]MDS0476934.1 IclR family transcriptional regulator [Natrinema sp. 1APR25-10V2]
MGTTNTDGLVNSDRRLLEIIAALQELDGAGVTEISEYTGMNTSTVHKHLKTLHHEQFVQKHETEYHLGLKFLDLGRYLQDKTELIAVAEDHLRDLADRVDELVSLSVKEYDYGVYLRSCNDKYDIQAATDRKIGQSRFDLHTSSAGKSILAELDDEQVESIVAEHGLEAQTETTITDPETLFAELETIRNKGFALNRGERIEGVWAIGSGFYSPLGDRYAAISITCPKHRLTTDEIREEYAEELLSTINEIELKLQFHDRN